MANDVGIKTAGGISTFDDAVKILYSAGARAVEDLTPDRLRLGASAGVKIVNQKE